MGLARASHICNKVGGALRYSLGSFWTWGNVFLKAHHGRLLSPVSMGMAVWECPQQPLLLSRSGWKGRRLRRHSSRAAGPNGCLYSSVGHDKSLHVWLFATLWTVAHQAPLSMGFSRRESWPGLPSLLPGDLPQPRDQTCVSCIGRRILYH